jgi:hypothetical protein
MRVKRGSRPNERSPRPPFEQLGLIERSMRRRIGEGVCFSFLAAKIVVLPMSDPKLAVPPTSAENPEVSYRSIEPWAVAGVLLGLLSAVSLLGTTLWLVAAAGVVANLIALARIQRDTFRDGRGAALLGLGLSIVFAVAPMAHWATTRWLLTRQARPVAELFLKFLTEDSPEKAMDLRLSPYRRLPFDDRLWSRFRQDKELGADLRKFVRDPPVRTLLALGNRADVRFYKTGAVATDGSRAIVSLFYTATIPADANRKDKTTFFLNVLLERNSVDPLDVNPWRVIDFAGGTDPRDPSGRLAAEMAAEE